jgi:hypothetical protein
MAMFAGKWGLLAFPAVARVIPLGDLGLYAAPAFRGVLLLPGRIPVRRGETVTVPGLDGCRSPRNRNPREAEAGSFSVT